MEAKDLQIVDNSSQDGAPLSPIRRYLAALHRELAMDRSGEVATYIPELGRADPNWFGIALATVDGEVYAVGDTDQLFSIQSVSKPFLYARALAQHGADYVTKRVGVEPTGDAFNSIILDDAHNRPFNPMVNAGAIAVAAMVEGADRSRRNRAMLDWMSSFAGRPLRIDETVYRSEAATGHRNRAIAYMMLNSGMIEGLPEDVLDLYFRQCSVEVTCVDLALMAATLANDGVQPRSGERIADATVVRDVLSVMSTCGMYNYAGQWSFDVGLPAKSGVSGGVIAVIPGQLGICVFSPPLDELGNSVRGVQVCKAISEEFGLHQFNNARDASSVIRREYTAVQVSSKRLRTPTERRLLEDHGNRIVVIEVQGALFFGSVERVVRRIAALAPVTQIIILDFKHVHMADQAAVRLLDHLVAALEGVHCRLALANLKRQRATGSLDTQLTERADAAGLTLYDDTDAALEEGENEILNQQTLLADSSKFALAKLDLFKGLSADECRVLEDLVQPLQFKAGDVIIREGDDANLLFVIARGSVSVLLPLDGGRTKRVAGIGPGLSFGEMALVDGGRRSARVVADETVVCYGFDLAALHELAQAYPNILVTILTNITREFSERLRRALEEIRALD